MTVRARTNFFDEMTATQRSLRQIRTIISRLGRRAGNDARDCIAGVLMERVYTHRVLHMFSVALLYHSRYLIAKAWWTISKLIIYSFYLIRCKIEEKPTGKKKT